MSTSRKWVLTFLICSTTVCYTCTSSLYTATYDQITFEFNCSRIVATLGLSLFIGGLGIGPMILAPLSEFYGRKPVYNFSFLLFIIWLVPCAVAQNIETMLIARFFSGFFGAAFSSVAGGTVGDLFPNDTLQAPMMVYSSSPLCVRKNRYSKVSADGFAVSVLVLAPSLEGSLTNMLHGKFGRLRHMMTSCELSNNVYFRRWSFYLLLIWAFFQWLAVCIFVPETYHPVLLRNKARKLREETKDQAWRAPIEKMEKSILLVSYTLYSAL